MRIIKQIQLIIMLMLCGHLTVSQNTLSRDELNEIIKDATIQIERDSLNVFYYEVRSSAYYELGELDKALSDIIVAVNLNPKSWESLYNKAVILNQLDRRQESIVSFDKALGLTENAEIIAARAIVYYELGRYDEAIAEYDRSINLDSKESASYNNRGLCYVKKGKFEKAINDFNIAIEINHLEERYFYNRGYAYYKLSDFEASNKDLNRSLELNPKSSYAYYYLYLLYRDLKDKNLSEKYFIKAKKYGWEEIHD